MDEYLYELEEDYCTYLGTLDNPHLVLKKCDLSSLPGSFITIDSHTEIILSNAFEGTGRLKLSASIKKIERDAFKECTILDLDYLGTTQQWCGISFENYYSNPFTVYTPTNDRRTLETKFDSVSVPSSITELSAYAFAGCIFLHTIIIPDSITYIGEGCFLNCIGLGEYSYSWGVSGHGEVRWTTLANWLRIKFCSETSNPIYYAHRVKQYNYVTSITLNSSTTVIPDYAFINFTELVNVTVSADVRYVGKKAFSGCSGLTLSVDNNRGQYIGSNRKILLNILPGTDLLTQSYVTIAVDISAETGLSNDGYLDTNNRILARYINGIKPTTKFILNNACENSSVTDLEFSEGIMIIGDNAFKNCPQLENIQLPSSVVHLGDGCFESCQSLKTLIFNSFIDEIPINMCYNCYSLESIEISAQIKNIGAHAFDGCVNLQSLIFTPTIGTSTPLIINNDAFSQCRKLTSISLPSRIKKIAARAFFGCNALMVVEVLFDNTVVIEEDAFGCCYKITEVYTPNMTLSVGSPSYGYLGFYAAKITQNANERASFYTDPDGFVLYGQYINNVFDYSTAFIIDYIGGESDIVIPEVEGIKSYAFYGSNRLAHVSFIDDHKYLKRIGREAFGSCDSLQYIEQNGFYYLSSNNNKYFVLVKTKNNNQSSKIEINNEIICTNALAGWVGDTLDITTIIPEYRANVAYSSNEHYLPFAEMFGKDNTYSDQTIAYYMHDNGNIYQMYYNIKQFTNLKVTGKMQYVPSYALAKYDSLQVVSLPDTIIKMGQGFLTACSSLTKITLPFIGEDINDLVAKKTTLFGSIFGQSEYENSTPVEQQYTDSSSTIVIYYIPSNLTSVTVCGGNLLFGVFENCSMLTEIILQHIITIGNYAFDSCSSITTLTIPSGITTIGDYVFYGCSNLTSIFIADTATSIGAGAFTSCSNLKTVYLGSGIESIGGTIFSGCPLLENIELPFVGQSKNDTTASASTLFSRLFGTSGSSSQYTSVTQYWDSSHSVTRKIPKTLQKVTIHDGRLLYGAFYGCSMLKNIKILNSIIIQDKAFYNCSALEKIEILNIENTIAGGVFYGCSALSEMTIPFIGKSLSSTLAADTFGYIFGTESYPNSRSTYQKYNYYYIPISLHKVTVLGGAIKNNSFYNCRDLLYITFYTSGSTIPQDTFRLCISVQEINVYGNITTIDSYAFYDCHELVTANIPSTVTEIKTSAFGLCYQLCNIDLSNVEQFWQEAFYRCTSLQEIKLLGTEVILNRDAFAYCSALSNIVFSDNQTYIGPRAFIGCTSLLTLQLPSHLTNLDSQAFYNCTSLKSVTIPSNTITILYGGTFGECTSLTNITIPVDITEFRTGVFGNCTSLSIINYGGTLSDWLNITFDGTSANPTQYAHNVRFSDGTTLTGNITIPSNTTSIRNYTFINCTGITRLILPDSGLTNIGFRACSGCSSLETINIPASVTTIGNYAFDGCESLYYVNTDLSGNMTSIGSYAFNNCTSLGAISIPNTVSSIGNYCFKNCSALESIVLSDAITTLSAGLFTGCSSLQYMTIPFVGSDGTTATASASSLFGYIFGTTEYDSSIPVVQYWSSSDTETYYIPSSLKEIEVHGGNILYGSFYGCNMLTAIRVSGAPIIGSYAFGNCSAMTALQINSATSIGYAALNGCSVLDTLTIPFVGAAITTTASNLTLFGYIFGSTPYTGSTTVEQRPGTGYAYSYELPTTLTTLTVTGGKILQGAFYNCSMLIDVTLSKDTIDTDDSMWVETKAFYQCTNLTTIAMLQNLIRIDEGAFVKCPAIQSMTLPFVGVNAVRTTPSAATVFGYIFEQSAGGVVPSGYYEYEQYYSASGSTKHYVPRTLTSVTITGGKFLYGALSYVKFTTLFMPKLTAIGDRALYQSTNLSILYFDGTVNEWNSIAFGTDWHYNIPATIVHCTDGDVNL